MPGLHIRYASIGEELLNRWHRLIAHISALGAPHKQRRAIIRDRSRLPVWEISHTGNGFAEDGERDTELHGLVFSRADQVGEEELADGEGLSHISLVDRYVQIELGLQFTTRTHLLISLQDLISLRLLRHIRSLNMLHATDVETEIALQGSIHGGVVNRYKGRDKLG